MFDFRYHALSLVAVFLALVVGLLLGVAIGDRGLVSSAESDLRASLRRNVEDARDRSRGLEQQLAERRSVEDQLYPILVGDRLAGARIGVVALGAVSDSEVDLVKQALQGTGGRLVSVSVIGEPLDVSGIAGAAGGTPFARLADRPDLLPRLGNRVGAQLVSGGDLLTKIRGALFQRSSGTLNGLDGVVLVRRPAELEGDQANAVSAFEDGLIKGLEASRSAAVAGVETTTTTPSHIRWYQDRRVSTVDDLDHLEGRAALVFVLAGARGSFGVKPTADSLLPSVVQSPHSR
jgi:Copper transport outer membrane protein, MctB